MIMVGWVGVYFPVIDLILEKKIKDYVLHSLFCQLIQNQIINIHKKNIAFTIIMQL